MTLIHTDDFPLSVIEHEKVVLWSFRSSSMYNMPIGAAASAVHNIADSFWPRYMHLLRSQLE